MKNEVYIVLFIYLIVNPTVLANLCLKRSNRLTKKSTMFMMGNAPNFCPGAKGKLKMTGNPIIPRNNKVKLQWMKTRVYPDMEAEMRAEAEAEEEKHHHDKKKNKKTRKDKMKLLLKKGKVSHRQGYNPAPNKYQPNKYQPGGAAGGYNPQGGAANKYQPGGAAAGYNPPGGAANKYQPGGAAPGKAQPGQAGEDKLNAGKMMSVPGNRPPTDVRGLNYFIIEQPGIDKLLKVITPKRWKKDWSKYERKECFGNLAAFNQGTCGCCFVFSSTSFFSITRCMATKQFIAMSHEDMVRCAPPNPGNSDNCDGGLERRVWEHMFDHGVVDLACQCYESGSGKIKQCAHTTCTVPGGKPTLYKPEVKDVIHIDLVSAMVYTLEYIGPLMGSLEIDPSKIPALNSFNQGIQGKVKYDVKSLFAEIAAGGEHAAHAVVIVGYRIRYVIFHFICFNSLMFLLFYFS